MLLTLWCILAPVASLIVIGAAVRGVLARGKALDETSWVQVPFVGLAVTVLVLQTPLYLGVPIRHGVFGLWALTAAIGACWAWQGTIRQSLAQIPWLPAGACAMVLAVHSYGLAVVGPRDYVGRSWADEFNYTAEAEYFRTEGIDLGRNNLGRQPWALTVIALKDHRIGQSVLHAYNGVLTRMDTLSQFMPTMLLGFPLIVLALYQSGRGLGLERWQATLAGFFGGLVPGIAQLAQESFLSHVLGIPLLLVLPAVLHAYTTRRDAGSLGTAFLCVGALASVYTEFLVFELVLVGGFLAMAAVQRPRAAAHLAGFALLLASPWLCNPLYHAMTSFLAPSAVATRPFVLGHIYPWAYERICLAVVWVGDFCLAGWMQRHQLLAARMGAAVMVSGAAGLVAAAVAAVVRWRRTGATPALPLALVALAVVPGLLLMRGPQYPYQFVKLLVTFCPLYALGAVLLGTRAANAAVRIWGPSSAQALARGTAWAPVLAMAACACFGSAAMAYKSTTGGQIGFRTVHQQLALRPSHGELRHRLEQEHDLNLLVRPTTEGLHWQQYWTLYFARHNRVWMASPVHNDGWNVLTAGAGMEYLGDAETLPPRFHVLCPRDSLYVQPPRGLPAAAVVWQTSGHLLWRYDGGPWACVLDADCPNGLEPHADRQFWLGGGDTVLRLFATEAGVVRLGVDLAGGPCLQPGEAIRLQIDDGTSPTALEVDAGPLTLPVPVRKGVNRLAVRVLNGKHASVPGDPRTLLARLQVRELNFEPQATAAAWACVTRVDNPNRFEDEDRRVLWLGGGDTVLQLWATGDGVARLELEVDRGPCLDTAELPRFRVTRSDGTERIVELPPGRRALEVPVAKGSNTVCVRPLNEPRGHAPGDPRTLLARWTLGEVQWRPGP